MFKKGTSKDRASDKEKKSKSGAKKENERRPSSHSKKNKHLSLLEALRLDSKSSMDRSPSDIDVSTLEEEERKVGRDWGDVGGWREKSFLVALKPKLREMSISFRQFSVNPFPFLIAPPPIFFQGGKTMWC